MSLALRKEGLNQLLPFSKILFVLIRNQFRNVLISQRHFSVHTQLFLRGSQFTKRKIPKIFRKKKTLRKLSQLRTKRTHDQDEMEQTNQFNMGI